MYLLILTWVILAWGALACIYLSYRAWTAFPRRDIDDVIHYLYPVDLALAETLLDPASDFSLRWSLQPRAYREAQRRRMRLYLELVRRMAHNSIVLVEYGNCMCREHEWAPESTTDTLQDAAIRVRLYSVVAKVKLRIRLLLPLEAMGFKNTIQLANLRVAGDQDGPKAYNDLKNAAAAAFGQLQPAELDALTRSL